MRFRIVSTALGLAATVAIAAPAMAVNHPLKANKFLSLFVKDYAQCTNPTNTHNPPLAFPACTPAFESGSTLVFGAKGFLQASGVVKVNSSKQASDVSLLAKAVDIRVGTPTGAGFSGVLTTSGTIRTTDQFCALPGDCTMVDIPFPIGLPCGTAASPALPPGKCAAKTSANGTVPGAVVPGKTANIALGQLGVFNGGNPEFVEGLYLN